MASKAETEKHISRNLLLKNIVEANWDECIEIVYNDGTYAKIAASNGNLPIHLVVPLGCPPRLAVLLITAYPDCIRIKDIDGNLPLHLAVRHHKGRLWISIVELFNVLYEAYPRGLYEIDNQGDCAIHSSLRCKGPDEMIKFIIKSYPDSVKIKDKRGNTALHLAIQYEANPLIIYELINLNPKAAQEPNGAGALPLHKVAFFNSPIDVFQMILEAYPTAATIKDKNGNLPLHLVYLNAGGVPDEAKLRIWMAANPLALSIKNKNGALPMMMFHRPQENTLEDYM